MTQETEKEQTPHGSISVIAVITRKDGTVEDLGVVSEGTISFDTPAEESE